MKKTVSLILAVILSVSAMVLSTGASGTSISAGEITEFSISSDKSYAEDFTSADSNLISLLKVVLDGAVSASVPADKISSQTKITVKTAKNKTLEYDLFLYEKDLYLRQGDICGKLDMNSWQELTKSLGNAFYKYAPIPVLTADSKSAHPSESSYIYKKVDGIFYRPIVSRKATLAFSSDKKNLPDLAFSVQPSALEIKVNDSGNTNTFTSVDEYKKYTPKTSTYEIVVKATYSSDYYRGDVVYPIHIKETTGTSENIKFTVKGSDTFPGELTVIRISGLKNADSIKFSSEFSPSPNFFKESNGDYVALLPVSYYTDTGNYTFKLSAGGKSQDFKIAVKDKKFQIQHLTADSSTTQETILSKQANDEFEKHIAPIRYNSDSTPYWKESGFVWPTSGGRVTTEFGMVRYVNGAPTSSRHGAIDIALPKGTRVNSTSNGKVLYAGFLQLTGNTVVIEHGYGLKSWYYHMNSLNIKTGDTVKAGQKIGEVGTTGFSTGNHLHFGFSVNNSEKNVWINPRTIVGTDLLK